MNKMQEEVYDFIELLRILFGYFGLVKPLAQFVKMAIKALMHPEDVIEWRTAYAFFVFPVVFIGGTAALVSAAIFWLLPSPWDWLLVCVWLFYILIGEPYMYYVEGDGFDRWERWIKYGGE